MQEIFVTQQWQLYQQLYQTTMSIKQELQTHTSFDESTLGLFSLQQDLIAKLQNLPLPGAPARLPEEIRELIQRIIQLNQEITVNLQGKQARVLQQLQESQRVNKGIAAYRLGAVAQSRGLDQQS